MGQLVGAIEGIGEACRALDFPIVSGNVSLYNETNGAAILPTPTIGGVGLLADWSTDGDASASRREGEAILLVGAPPAGARISASRSICARSTAARTARRRRSTSPHEKRVGDFVRGLIRDGIVTAVHDLSDGGLAVALAEMAMASGIGADDRRSSTAHRRSPAFFGEDQGRYLVTVRPRPTSTRSCDARPRPPASSSPWIGTTGGDRFETRRGACDICCRSCRRAHESLVSGLHGRRGCERRRPTMAMNARDIEALIKTALPDAKVVDPRSRRRRRPLCRRGRLRDASAARPASSSTRWSMTRSRATWAACCTRWRCRPARRVSRRVDARQTGQTAAGPRIKR